ncbi:MAG TPA: hypothetical protein VFW03_09965 [Gemmatimonadaceae bacterium]|nr:hypothetical protein [Gemmatimonadaceae bacterium]
MASQLLVGVVRERNDLKKHSDGGNGVPYSTQCGHDALGGLGQTYRCPSRG